jgi:hypothetical protein
VTEWKVWICVTLAVRFGRSPWPRGLMRGSATTLFLGLRVWIPPGACLSWVLCVVRQRSLRRADHSTECVCVSLSVIEESRRGSPGPLGCRAMRKIKEIVSERQVSRHTLAFHAPCSAEVRERVQLHLYSASRSTSALLGRTLPYLHPKRLLRRPWQIKC